MAAGMHAPVITDVVTNPVYHRYEEFFKAWNVSHADLNMVMNAWIVMGILIISALIVRSRLSTVPNQHQNFWEVVVSTLEDLLVQTMGERGRPYFPLIATLALYIVGCNLIGILAGFSSATNNLNTTLSLALVSFLMTHWVGFRAHGLRYYKHFLGPIPALIPLMLPIEIISHLSRVLSLSFRLFGNIMGEDIAVVILTLLVPYFVPLPMMFLQVFTSLIQTLVFIMLTMMYITGSLEEAH